MGIRRQGHALLSAVQFLTRLPVPGGMHSADANDQRLADALVWFPVVGVAIGVYTGGIIWAAAQLWPMMLAILLGLVAEAVLTGALHEDAVADCADAFGGGWTREDVFRILKDSRLGSFGGLTLILVVVLRITALVELPLSQLFAVTVAAATSGRWIMVILLAGYPPVPERESLMRAFSTLSPLGFIGAALFALIGHGWWFWLAPGRCLGGLTASVVLCGLWGWFVCLRLGGLTGDTIGAAGYLAQLTMLLAATVS